MSYCVVLLRTFTITICNFPQNVTNPTCVSWDFNINGEIIYPFLHWHPPTISCCNVCLPALLSGGLGGWSPEGCEIVVNQTDPSEVMCSCNHLTNFAVLVVRFVLPLDIRYNKSSSHKKKESSVYFTFVWHLSTISISPSRTFVHGLAVIQSLRD